MYTLDKKEIFQFPNAKWVLPFYCTHKDFCFSYVDFLAKVIGNYDFIKCVYGAPYCALNNGNLPINKKYDGYIDELNQWNNRKIPVWVTFSNYKATIKDIKSDEKVMKLLKALSKNNDQYGLENGVIVASDTFRKFLRINYPNLKVIASVIFQTLSNSPYSKELYKEMETKYDMICIGHHHNNKFPEWCEDLAENKDMYEIMLNCHCNYGCQFIKNCYEWQAKDALGLVDTNCDNDIYYGCPTEQEMSNKILVPSCRYTVFNYEDTKYIINKGFVNLKLTGRQLDLDSLKVVVYGWMININYRDIIERTLKGKSQTDTGGC